MSTIVDGRVVDRKTFTHSGGVAGRLARYGDLHTPDRLADTSERYKHRRPWGSPGSKVKKNWDLDVQQ